MKGPLMTSGGSCGNVEIAERFPHSHGFDDDDTYPSNPKQKGAQRTLNSYSSGSSFDGKMLLKIGAEHYKGPGFLGHEIEKLRGSGDWDEI
jgi:hypothetical protein